MREDQPKNYRKTILLHSNNKNKLKIVLIGLFVLAGTQEFSRRFVTLFETGNQLTALAAFCMLLVLCILSLIGAGLIRNVILRWSLAVFLAAGSMMVDSYQWVVGDFMDYEAFITMIQSAENIGEAAAQHGEMMIFAAGKAIILLVGIGLKPAVTQGIFAMLLKLLSAPIILVLALMLFFRGGEGASGLPSSHSGLSYGLLYGYEYLTQDHRPREAVAIKPARAKQVADIVLIVDESIAGAYLDINSKTGVYSGLVDPKTKAPVHNFGLAAAITNCSVGANVTLRYGGTRDNYSDTVKSKPSIWAYAKAVNLETIYIDAQRTGGVYQNMMDAAERVLIDKWDQFEDVSVLNRDHAVADRLAEYLNDNKQQFILINKIGGHFPVSDKFPNSHARYSPMLKRQFADVSEAPPDNLDGRQSNWVLYRNSYRNTLLWNVGGFFDRLFAKSEIGNAMIIYTSDHGQTFHERGEYGEATHCTSNPEIEEGVVPLILIGGPSSEQARWAKAAKANHDQLSNYRIFPTLLRAMGYAKRDIEEVYGFDLLSDEPDPFTFNVNFNARLGGDPIWIHIPLAKIARPALSDFSKKAKLPDQ